MLQGGGGEIQKWEWSPHRCLNLLGTWQKAGSGLISDNDGGNVFIRETGKEGSFHLLAHLSDACQGRTAKAASMELSAALHEGDRGSSACLPTTTSQDAQ